MATIGYARVSTRDQELTIQREALTAAGCSKIYAEKISRAKSDRAQLTRLVKALEPGDILILTRLDRLARSTRDLLNLVHKISEAGRPIPFAGRCVVRYDQSARAPVPDRPRRSG